MTSSIGRAQKVLGDRFFRFAHCAVASIFNARCSRLATGAGAPVGRVRPQDQGLGSRSTRVPCRPGRLHPGLPPVNMERSGIRGESETCARSDSDQPCIGTGERGPARRQRRRRIPGRCGPAVRHRQSEQRLRFGRRHGASHRYAPPPVRRPPCPPGPPPAVPPSPTPWCPPTTSAIGKPHAHHPHSPALLRLRGGRIYQHRGPLGGRVSNSPWVTKTLDSDCCSLENPDLPLSLSLSLPPPHTHLTRTQAQSSQATAAARLDGRSRT